MKKILPAILITLFLLSALAANSAIAGPNPSGEIDFSALDAAIAAQMDKHGLPGVELAVIENEQIVYLKAYGVDGNNQPLTPRTPMLIGSQSKSFTALAIAQLAEQGRLKLDAPVQAYIPWFQVADPAASSLITLNHLLHHTSGLSDSGYAVLLPDDASLEQATRSLASARLTARVGAEHQYFNLGYTVLAYIVELTSGQSYADYVSEHILVPLQMSSTTAAPETARNMPPGHTRLFGFALPVAEAAPVYGVGAGFIVSSAEDMARYAIAFQTGGASLVSPQMLRRILTPGVGGYGMGWYIFDNGAKILHGGANQTFRTEVNLYPRQHRAFVLLTNEGYQFDHFISAGQLTASVEAIVLGRSAPPISNGWSVRWVGWAAGLFVLALAALHTHNFLALRGWSERARRLSPARRAGDVAISFLIPSVILLVIFWQVSQFYGDRFNLATSLAYLRLGMPDIFLLSWVGTLPDYIQGFIKIFLWLKHRSPAK